MVTWLVCAKEFVGQTTLENFLWIETKFSTHDKHLVWITLTPTKYEEVGHVFQIIS